MFDLALQLASLSAQSLTPVKVLRHTTPVFFLTERARFEMTALGTIGI